MSGVRRRAATGAGVVAMLIAALSVGQVVVGEVDEIDVLSPAQPFVARGTVGEPIELRYAEVTATRVRATDRMHTPSGGEETSTAVFLVVDLEVVARHRSSVFNGLRVVGGDGRTYLATSRTGCADAGVTASTGVPTYWMACVELPESALEGAALQVARGGEINTGDRRDHLAEIDLGIDAALAERLARASAPIQVEQPGFQPYPGAGDGA